MKILPSLLLICSLAATAAAQDPVGAPPLASAALKATILPITAPADPRLTITPDHADWTYPLGSVAHFRVMVTADPYPAAGVPVKYKLGSAMLEGAEKDAFVPAEGLVLTTETVKEPGFIRCIVSTTLDGKPAHTVATAGFAPEKIAPTQTEPADFDAFWTQQKAALAKVPPDFQLTPAPGLSTPGVETSYINYQNVGGWAGPSHFYGVLCVPRGPGPFPALLNVPGAGVRAYGGLRSLAEKGIITLQVGVHGIPVNLPPELYTALSLGALEGYNRYNLDDRNAYYYRRIYLGCLRGNDYLVSHPKWDGKNLVVMGGSQGGQLSIMMAALDPRVTALAASYPAYCDVSGYLHGRAGGWPGLFRPGRDGKPADAPVEPKLLTTTYYDSVNFARRLKVPGFYFWGYNDETCPPTSTFAAYNVINSPKELLIAPEQGHHTSNAQQEHIDAWVLHQVGLK